MLADAIWNLRLAAVRAVQMMSGVAYDVCVLFEARSGVSFAKTKSGEVAMPSATGRLLPRFKSKTWQKLPRALIEGIEYV